MKKDHTKVKLNIQLALGVLLVVVGIILIFIGFYAYPIGDIANSVLVAYGEISTFAGALIGVDYSYKFKTFKLEEEEKTKRSKENYATPEINEEEHYAKGHC